MNILVIGRGGREHAIAWKISRSPRCTKVWIAPGNGGTPAVGENVPIEETDFDDLISFVHEHAIDLTIVGPEAPLARGIVERFRAEGLLIAGPTSAGAQLESSKAFTKEFLARHRIPTAGFAIFGSADGALAYIKTKNTFPIVLKADGLAAGKGVIIPATLREAEEALAALAGLGTASLPLPALPSEGSIAGFSDRIVVEEFLDGEEASFIVFTDGTNIVPLELSQDHKRVFDGDRGPNTGGMGAYTPVTKFDSVKERAIKEIIQPTLDGLKADGIAFSGILYAGLMVLKDGLLSLLEYNVRLGDPEAEPLLLNADDDLLPVFLGMAKGDLGGIAPIRSHGAAVGVVLASGGYPGAYEKGKEIAGLDMIDDPDVVVFHAGTKRVGTKYVTDGGRVLCVTAKAETLAAARDKAYAQIEKIKFDGTIYRKDIGRKSLG